MSRVQLNAVLNLIDVNINPAIFRRISAALAGSVPATVNIYNNMQRINRTTQNFNTTLRNTTAGLSNASSISNVLLRRMAQFAILLPTFVTLNNAIQGSVRFLFEFDNLLRDVVRVDVKGLASRMEEIGDAALGTAREFGVTGTTVLELQKTFVQAGLTIEQAQERSRLAIIATQTSTLESADAIEFLIAASEQFGLSTSELEAALDGLVKVEDAAAVEAQDIAEAFRTGGNSLAAFSKNINDSIGLISALRQQTRKSGREIGTFFKTLQTRIFAAGDARSAVEALGVTVQNLDGSLRPTKDVLNDLKDAFDGLSEAQQANAAKAIGGVRQYESLVATLNSLDNANRLSELSAQASGAAEEKRIITDEKLNIVLGKLISQGESLAEALGDAGIEDTIVKALKAATALLEVFTKMANVVNNLGGNLAPLLALGGVMLGRSVFGFGRGPATGTPPIPPGGGPIPPVPPVPPLPPPPPTVNPYGTGRIGRFAQTVDTFRQTPQGVAGLTTLGLVLPIVTDKLGDFLNGLNKSNNVLASASIDALKLSGETAAVTAQFAVLGPNVAAAAGAFSSVVGAISTIKVAYDEEIKARNELKKAKEKEVQSSQAFQLMTTRLGAGLLEQLSQSVRGREVDKNIQTQVNEAFSRFASTNLTEAGIAGLGQQDIAEALFSNPRQFKEFISSNKDYLESIAKQEGTTQQLTELFGGLADGSLQTGQAFKSLLLVLGAGERGVNETTGAIKRAFDFQELLKGLEISGIVTEIDKTNREIASVVRDTTNIQTNGINSVKDEIDLLKSKLDEARLSANITGESLDKELTYSFINLKQSLFSLKDTELSNFVTDLQNLPNISSETEEGRLALENLKKTIRDLAPAEQKAVEEVLKAQNRRVQNGRQAEEEALRLQEAIRQRELKLFEENSNAALSAFENQQKLNAELAQFGKGIDLSILSKLQDISTIDIENVLSGVSELEQPLQDLIKRTFGTAINQGVLDAQNKYDQTLQESSSILAILENRLNSVNEKIGMQAYVNERASLLIQKSSLEKEIENEKTKSSIQIANARLNVLDAEIKAQEKAKEAAEKLREARLRLTDAERNLSNEVFDANRSFEEFRQQKISELFEEEANARNQLKEAQKAIIDSTNDLSEAYAALEAAETAFADAIADGSVQSSKFARDIAQLNGEIIGFNGQLSSITQTFTSALSIGNISLQKRIELERQLAEETLSFLQQTRDSIIGAGTQIFGQAPEENRALMEGIAGLRLVADQLGGSFQSFLSLDTAGLQEATNSLLSLPVDFRKQILSALSFLPSTMSVGGFSIDQLREAIGQIGAGISPEAGLPSIEELGNQQIEQLRNLQELALQDAQLQFSQVTDAKEQLELAKQQLEVSKIQEQRASENLTNIQALTMQEFDVLVAANEERRQLLEAIMSTDDRNTLAQLEQEAKLFDQQNTVFRDIGNTLVNTIQGVLGARLAQIEAKTELANLTNRATGYIPNFAKGNLSPREAAGLLRAASREKRMMPTGASLAVANTSEAIIPMHNRGYLPNFAEGNYASPIAAGIESIRGINETIVAAISRSVTQALADLRSGEDVSSSEILSEILSQLTALNETSDEINSSNAAIQSNTTSTNVAAQSANGQSVRIVLETNQNNTVNISGLANLRSEIDAAVRTAASEQVDAQLESLLQELDNVITALQERGLITSFNQPR